MHSKDLAISCTFLRPVVLTLFVSLLTLSPMSYSATQTSVAKVLSVIGEANAVGDNQQPRVLQRRSQLFQGDKIVTAAKSKVQIRFTDSSLLTLQSNSEYIIDEYYLDEKKNRGANKGRLLKGGFKTLTGKIAEQFPENYKIKTDLATMGVRGTFWGAVLTRETSLNPLNVSVWHDSRLGASNSGVWVENEVSRFEIGPGRQFNHLVVTGQTAQIQGRLQQSNAFEDSPTVGSKKAKRQKPNSAQQGQERANGENEDGGEQDGDKERKPGGARTAPRGEGPLDPEGLLPAGEFNPEDGKYDPETGRYYGPDGGSYDPETGIFYGPNGGSYDPETNTYYDPEGNPLADKPQQLQAGYEPNDPNTFTGEYNPDNVVSGQFVEGNIDGADGGFYYDTAGEYNPEGQFVGDTSGFYQDGFNTYEYDYTTDYGPLHQLNFDDAGNFVGEPIGIFKSDVLDGFDVFGAIGTDTLDFRLIVGLANDTIPTRPLFAEGFSPEFAVHGVKRALGTGTNDTFSPGLAAPFVNTKFGVWDSRGPGGVAEFYYDGSKPTEFVIMSGAQAWVNSLSMELTNFYALSGSMTLNNLIYGRVVTGAGSGEIINEAGISNITMQVTFTPSQDPVVNNFDFSVTDNNSVTWDLAAPLSLNVNQQIISLQSFTGNLSGGDTGNFNASIAATITGPGTTLSSGEVGAAGIIAAEKVGDPSRHVHITFGVTNT